MKIAIQFSTPRQRGVRFFPLNKLRTLVHDGGAVFEAKAVSRLPFVELGAAEKVTPSSVGAVFNVGINCPRLKTETGALGPELRYVGPGKYQDPSTGDLVPASRIAFTFYSSSELARWERDAAEWKVVPVDLHRARELRKKFSMRLVDTAYPLGKAVAELDRQFRKEANDLRGIVVFPEFWVDGIDPEPVVERFHDKVVSGEGDLVCYSTREKGVVSGVSRGNEVMITVTNQVGKVAIHSFPAEFQPAVHQGEAVCAGQLLAIPPAKPSDETRRWITSALRAEVVTQIDGRPAVNLRYLSPDDFPRKGEGVWVQACDSTQVLAVDEDDLVNNASNPLAPFLLRFNLSDHWDNRSKGAVVAPRAAVQTQDAVHLTERLQVPATVPAGPE